MNWKYFLVEAVVLRKEPQVFVKLVLFPGLYTNETQHF